MENKFNSALHPRGHITNAGSFVKHDRGLPESGLPTVNQSVTDLTAEQFSQVADAAAATVDRWAPAQSNLGSEHSDVDYGFSAWTDTDEEVRSARVIVLAPCGNRREEELFNIDGIPTLVDTTDVQESGADEATAILSSAWDGWFGSDEANQHFQQQRDSLDEHLQNVSSDWLSVHEGFSATLEFSGEPTKSDVQTVRVLIIDANGDEVEETDLWNNASIVVGDQGRDAGQYVCQRFEAIVSQLDDDGER